MFIPLNRLAYLGFLTKAGWWNFSLIWRLPSDRAKRFDLSWPVSMVERFLADRKTPPSALPYTFIIRNKIQETPDLSKCNYDISYILIFEIICKIILFLLPGVLHVFQSLQLVLEEASLVLLMILNLLACLLSPLLIFL